MLRRETAVESIVAIKMWTQVAQESNLLETLRKVGQNSFFKLFRTEKTIVRA
jgi:hypothetical protein